MAGFGKGFGAGFAPAFQQSVALGQQQRQFDATLEQRTQQRQQQEAEARRAAGMKAIEDIAKELPQVRAAQGPEGVQKNMQRLDFIAEHLSAATGVPKQNILERWSLAAQTGATGTEKGMQEGAAAAAAAPGKAQAITATTPAEAARAQASRIMTPTEFDQKVRLAQESRAETNINLPKNVTETEATLQAIADNREKFKKTGDPQFNRLADKLEVNLTFGGKAPPEGYVEAAGAVSSAREGVTSVYNLLKDGTSSLTPGGRANLQQAFSNMKLAYAQLTKRGANFTENEEQIVDTILGGNPTDVVQRAVRGDEGYLDTLKKAAGIIETRAQSLLNAYTKPMKVDFKYPWDVDIGDIPPAAIKQLKANPDTAAQFDEIFGDGAAKTVLGK